MIDDLANGFINFLQSKIGKSLTFIQIGVNDGINSDFVRKRVLNHAWTGLLIEPHPSYFKMAQEAYAGYEGVYWENCAISDSNGEEELYYVKEVPKDKNYLIGVASFDRGHIIKHGVEPDNIDSKKVPTITLSRLINKYKLSNIDLLVIDVEGHEYNALRSADFNYFKPKLIVIETSHMSRDDFVKIVQLFPENNYRGVYSKEFQDSVIYRIE